MAIYTNEINKCNFIISTVVAVTEPALEKNLKGISAWMRTDHYIRSNVNIVYEL